jgi:DNA-binding response OmpR family regulator
MAKILIADDDAKLVEMITDWLDGENFTVESASNGIQALDLMKSFGFDVIVLDWDMPGYIGPDVCKEYRDWGGKAPILMLTGKGRIEEKEKGFLSGADDYLTKPFHPKELSLRIRALLGRSAQTGKSVLKFGNLTLDVTQAKGTVDGKSINLTSREFALLEFLMRHQGEVFSAEALIDRVWKSDAAVSDKAVRVCISRLREKLSGLSCPNVTTVAGFGYKLDLES